MNDSYDAGSNLLGDLVPGEYLMRVSVPARTVGHGDYLVTLVVTGPLGGAMASRLLQDFATCHHAIRLEKLKLLIRLRKIQKSPMIILCD